MVILMIICLMTMVLSIIILIRNDMVFKYQQRLLEEVSRLAADEINGGIYGHWRRYYEWLDSVSYDEMVIKFWKPLDSFYGPMPESLVNETV